MYQTILVAYNGTPESRVALQECRRMALPKAEKRVPPCWQQVA
jgi:hypothetical protein